MTVKTRAQFLSDADTFLPDNTAHEISAEDVRTRLKDLADSVLFPADAVPAHTHTIANITSLQTSLDAKAPLASPALTGTPTAPTAAGGTNTTQLATTAFVTSAIASKANLASPTFTGTPAAPTATAGTNTTQIATTAFVQAAVSSLIDAAPATLNTLNELAAALGDDPNFATTISTQIGTKLDAASYTAADVLSKLLTVDGAASGLDADLLDGQHGSYYLALGNTTGTIDDTKHGSRGGGTLHAAATTSVAGFMSAADKTKLDGIATSANNYVLPTRLGTTALSVANWNTAVDNGWYSGVDATNAPTPTGTYVGYVEAYNGSWCTQTVHEVLTDGSSDTVAYRRSLNDGVWSAWYRLRSSQGELDARYLGLTAKAADADLLDGQNSTYYTDIAARLGFTPANASHTHAIADVTNLQTSLDAKAPLASPTFTGTPAAPTASGGTNTTQIATTAFVTSAVSTKANIASPTFTGVPAAPTAAGGTNTTQIATTAFVTSAVSSKLDSASYTAADVLAKLITVDGATSGLDADLLDGQHASAFAASSHTHASTDVTDFASAVDARIALAAYQPVNANLTSISALADPNADRILFWDDSDGAYTFLTASTGLTLSGTNLTVRTASATQTGIVELATDAEAQTGTDTTRALTPANAKATYQPLATVLTNTTASFTTAQESKLAGIEAGATADQTASEILTLLLTVDGTTSGLDADLLDGQHASAFAAASHSHAISDVTGLQSALDAKSPLASPTFTGTPAAPTATGGTNTTQIATTAFVQSAISSLIDAAPTTLNTLNELAAALGDDPNFATTISTQIGTKLDSASYTAADVLSKLLTVDGAASGLDADLLDGQHASAFATSGHTHSDATTSVAGFMSAADKTKLDGIATSANNYSHPTGDGNLHVPATSTTNDGKFLKAGATAGSLSWHTLVKADVGLGNVDNTSDANKPISTATQTALDGKAATSHTHTIANITSLQTTLDAKAPLASPTFTGVPAAPTASGGTNTTQIATTAFVTTAVSTKLNSSSYTAADVLSKLLTVDGAASGLDADLLDGQQGSYYTDIAARLGFTPANKAGDTFTGAVTIQDFTLSANGAEGGQMKFKKGTDQTALAGDIIFDTLLNSMRFFEDGGGFRDMQFNLVTGGITSSAGGTFWHSGNDGAASGLDADLLDGQHASAFATSGHTHSDATTSVAGFLSAADKTKLDGIAANANNYSHPTGDGNLHVPATSTTNDGKFLKAGATAGSLSWYTLAKADVGLGNVDNTSDANKPVSTATQTALDAKAPLASPALTGTPTAPTATGGTNTTQIATTAFVQAAFANDSVTNAKLANMAASTIKGRVTASTGDPEDLTATQVKTILALVKADVGLGNVDNTSDVNKPVSTAQQTALNLKANLASPTFTGTPAAPTATGGTNTTQIATTAFVTSAVASKLDSASYTASDVLSKLLTVDGAASGIDADLLDGQHGSYYATASGLTTVEGKVLPAGGTTGQVLKKSSATDYAVEWGSAGGGDVPVPFSFTGDGTTTAFDITETIGSANRVLWFEDGIWQQPGVHFTTSGSVVTRGTAPANGALIYGLLLGDAGVVSVGSHTHAISDVTNLETRLTTSPSSNKTASSILVAGDAGKTVVMDVATANNLEVPPNGDVAFPVETFINIEQYGAGQTTIVAGTGVTIRSKNGLKLSGQYAMATLRKIGTNEWMLGGDLVT